MWIKFTDQLPEEGRKIDVIYVSAGYGRRFIDMDFYEDEGGEHYVAKDNEVMFYTCSEAVYWMYSPEMPEGVR